MSKIKCLIIDDEPPAIELLHAFCAMVDQLEVVGACNSAVKAFDLLKDLQVDLIFLDIQMPVLSGIEFIKTLKNPPKIIITTAHRKYALDGFELDVVDFLLKPISFDRFLKAVDRYRGRSSAENLKVNTKEAVPAYLFFNVNRTHHKVIIADIRYIESLKDYVRIYTATDKLVVKGNIGMVLKRLPSSQFVRVHRSFVVSKSHVNAYNQNELDIGGVKIPIGVSFKDQVKEWFS